MSTSSKPPSSVTVNCAGPVIRSSTPLPLMEVTVALARAGWIFAALTAAPPILDSRSLTPAVPRPWGSMTLVQELLKPSRCLKYPPWFAAEQSAPPHGFWAVSSTKDCCQGALLAAAASRTSTA